jgi:Domain of unknown function (DUF397)
MCPSPDPEPGHTLPDQAAFCPTSPPGSGSSVPSRASVMRWLAASAWPSMQVCGRSRSGGRGLEVKKLPGGRVALRQSTDPASPALILELAEIRAFIDGAKAGLADDLLT